MKRIALILAAAVWLPAVQGCSNDQPSGGDNALDAGGESAAAPAIKRTPSAPGAAAFIITPTNGATVSSPVTIKFGISGMAVAPAGDLSPDTGHHHLLIDTELADATAPIPTDDNHRHFGKGQTETSVELAPGEHTLQLVLADGNHVPHDPPVVSQQIRITVE